MRKPDEVSEARVAEVHPIRAEQAEFGQSPDVGQARVGGDEPAPDERAPAQVQRLEVLEPTEFLQPPVREPALAVIQPEPPPGSGRPAGSGNSGCDTVLANSASAPRPAPAIPNGAGASARLPLGEAERRDVAGPRVFAGVEAGAVRAHPADLGAGLLPRGGDVLG